MPASTLVVASPAASSSERKTPPAVLSYIALRRVAGWIGIALPVIVVIFDRFVAHRPCIPSSISASYYTGTRNVFIGSLCSVGVFMLCSLGYPKDRPWSVLAGATAFLVAFCPTTPDSGCHFSGAPTTTPFPHSEWIHAGAAVALFLTFAIFCIFLFTRIDDDTSWAEGLRKARGRKKTRNAIYLTCGTIMVIAMATFGIWHLAKGDEAPRYLLLIVEWVCLWAFGFAWLVKGEQMFSDARDPAAAEPQDHYKA